MCFYWKAVYKTVSFKVLIKHCCTCGIKNTNLIRLNSYDRIWFLGSYIDKKSLSYL
jgi:hypothetical protein